MTVELRAEWRCDGCGVAVYTPGKKTPRPRLWQSDDQCNQCWVRAASGAANEGDRREEIAQRRRKRSTAGSTATAMTWKKTKQQEKKKPRKRPTGTKTEKAEIELRTDPSRSNAEIGEVVDLSRTRVRAIRRRMKIPPPKLDYRGRPIREAA